MASGLPPGWAAYTTDDGKEYYHHAGKGVTQWERPVEATNAAEVYQPDIATLDLSSSATARPSASLAEVSLSPMTGPATSPTIGASGGPTGTMGFAQESHRPAATPAAADLDVGSRTQRLCALCTVETLQEYFDVSTAEVKERIRAAVMPFKVDSEPFRISPDFWGPFWVSTTTVLFIGGCANFGHIVELGSTAAKTDYSLAGYAASVVYGLLIGVPLLIRAAEYMLGSGDVNYRQLICAYGYSFFVFIPVAILCTIPVGWLKTIFFTLALAWSLAFLNSAVYQDLDRSNPKLRLAAGAVLLGAQLTLVGFCRFSFFAGSPKPITPAIPEPIPPG